MIGCVKAAHKIGGHFMCCIVVFFCGRSLYFLTKSKLFKREQGGLITE